MSSSPGPRGKKSRPDLPTIIVSQMIDCIWPPANELPSSRPSVILYSVASTN